MNGLRWKGNCFTLPILHNRSILLVFPLGVVASLRWCPAATSSQHPPPPPSRGIKANLIARQSTYLNYQKARPVNQHGEERSSNRCNYAYIHPSTRPSVHSILFYDYLRLDQADQFTFPLRIGHGLSLWYVVSVKIGKSFSVRSQWVAI